MFLRNCFPWSHHKVQFCTKVQKGIFLAGIFGEWRQKSEQQNSQLKNTKQRNNKTVKLLNSEKQNDDHYKTANTTKERTFVKNGELTT